jgi:hypothetical protein
MLPPAAVMSTVCEEDILRRIERNEKKDAHLGPTYAVYILQMSGWEACQSSGHEVVSWRSCTFGLPTSTRVLTVVWALAHASGGSVSNAASVSAFDKPERGIPASSSCIQVDIQDLASHPSRSISLEAAQSPCRDSNSPCHPLLISPAQIAKLCI